MSIEAGSGSSGSVGRWWRTRRRRLLRIWGIGVAISVAVTTTAGIGYYEGSQARALDFMLKLRGQRLSTDVVIVAIDDAAFKALGERQPLPRAYIARVLQGLRRAGAATVGLDITLTRATTRSEDAALAAAITTFADGGLSRVVVLGPLPEKGPLAGPAFRRRPFQASPEVRQESDGVVRNALLLLTGAHRPEPSLALATVARFAGAEPEAFAQKLREAGVDGPVRINFAGAAKTFLTIPSDVLWRLADPAVPVPEDNPVRGRVVFVGATFEDSRDFFQTPYGVMPGVEVHANVAHMLLTRGFIVATGWRASLALQLVCVFLVGLIMVATRPLVAGALCFVVPVAVGVPISYYAFDSGGYWIDFALPVAATHLLGSAIGVMDRRRVRAALGRYVSREVAAQVFLNAPSLDGERRDVSILFSDLRGFTSVSETMAPDVVAAQLNELFEAMTAAIFRHRGMVNDFIGDAVMAIFGSPLADRDHALHAVRAARDMEAALAALNVRWTAEGRPALRMGIGIHTGNVFAGNVGGKSRLKYTIVGDAVNLASRVEGINKELGTTMLITEGTYRLVTDWVTVRDCGPVPVKGRNETVRVYELLAVDEGGGTTARDRR
jgi:adenylate cyclase